jgi:hypothetical protein
MLSLPDPRGPLSEAVITRLHTGPARALPQPDLPAVADPLSDDDLHLALYLCYELSYRGLPGVGDEWEWEPSLLVLRRALERVFEAALRGIRTPRPSPAGDTDVALRSLIAADDAPSVSRYLERSGTREQVREFLIHRSAYQLKEADPHSFAIPRLAGAAKVALVEIQSDEYGGGRPERVHAELFRRTMVGAGLDERYGAYVAALPGVTLATVNLMSMCGLNRRLRGAIVGHLACFEMTSSIPNRRYANALRRLGYTDDAIDFFDEHVEADAVHENLAAVDLAGGFVRDEPDLAGDVMWGAAALLHLDGRWARHMLTSWGEGRSSLLGSPDPPRP